MIAVVEQLRAELHDQPANPLRPAQVRDYEDELVRLGAIEAGRDVEGQKAMDGAPGQGWLRSAAPGSQKEIRRIRGILAAQRAKKVTGDRANRVHALVKETLETVIRPAMLPRAALRRNPPGAVGHLLRTEFNGQFKEAVLAVKSGLRALDPDNADPDFTNMERFRPEGQGDGTQAWMADAQIPGMWGLSNRAKANWPLDDSAVNSAVNQVRRREDAEAPAPRAATPKPPRPAKAPAAVTATCGCGREFRGGFGPANLRRHQARDHAGEGVAQAS